MIRSARERVWKPWWRRVRFRALKLWLLPLAGLPRRPGLRAFEWAGLLAYLLLPRPRRRIDANCRLIFPDWPASRRRGFTRRVFRHLGRNGFDFIRLQRYSHETIRELVAIEGLENLHRARRPGMGIVCLSAHLGCWELIPYRMRIEGFDVAVVYRRIRAPDLNAFVAARRRRFGIETLDRDGAVWGIVRCLARGALVGMLIDQRTSVDSVRVPFLGRPAWTPTGPIRLAMRLGAPIVPIVVTMEADGSHRLQIAPEVELAPVPPGAEPDRVADVVRENTRRCNDALSRIILERKEQWVWFHRRWHDVCTVS